MRECDPGFQFLPGRVSFPRTKIDRNTRRLTRRVGAEGELRLPILEDTVIDFLVERVHVGEPSDTSTCVALTRHAIGIQKAEVVLHLLQAGDSGWGDSCGRGWCLLGPTVLGKDDLLPVHVAGDPVQIVLDEAPGIISGCSCGAEIRQHGETDKVDGIQNRWSAVVGLVAGNRFRGSDENPKRGEVLLGSRDLGGEVIHGQDVTGKSLGTDLNGPGDELGLGVVIKTREQVIPAGRPPVVLTVGIELAGG